MPDRNTPGSPSSAVARLPANARGPRLHIETLRVRTPGRDKAAGHAFAAELTAKLAALGATLLAEAGSRDLELGTLRLSLDAPTDGTPAAGAASSAIEAALLRALRSGRHGAGGGG